MWLSGLKSEMASTKAGAVADWAAEQGLGCLRFDYSGHGQSERPVRGRHGEPLARGDARGLRPLTEGPQVLIGSSMGGYIALLLLRALMAEAPAARPRASRRWC